MTTGELTPDALDQIIVQGEQEIAKIRATQMAAVSVHKAMGTHARDGYRSIVDWTAARADISPQTARRLCWTSSRLVDKPEVSRALANGEISFDRAEQLARLPKQQRSDHEGFDISQLRRRVAHYRRLTGKRERETGSGFLNFQPSLDETVTHFWGDLPGLESRIVEKAVDQRADEILGSEAKLGVAERRSLGLVAVCQDSLYTTNTPEEAPTAGITVTVDARTAARDGGETGVAVLGGARIGPKALEAVVCNSIVEVIGILEDGEPLSLGRRSRTVSPALRRHVLTRDMGCTVDGCSSRYRLEVHHTTPFSRGGRTDAKDLITLCWYHHHVVIHRWGYTIDRIGRSLIRLVRRNSTDPP